MDSSAKLRSILDSLLEVNRELGILFPAHSRTRQRIQECVLSAGQMRILDPLPYIDFLALEKHATVVITDSGGIQEETTFMGVPCLTLRENTEGPITVSLGANVLVGQDADMLREELQNILQGRTKKSRVPSLWDGLASERIADILQIRSGRSASA